jgi:hypothetical protein
VTTATLTERTPSLGGRPVIATALVLLGALLTAAAVIVGNGHPVIALAPIVAAVGAYGFYVLPSRYTLFGLIFVSLAIDAVEEGPWSSPLAPLGSLLANNLNKTIPIGALKFPGLIVVMLAMLALLFHRHLVGNRIDSFERTPTTKPLLGALVAGMVTVFLMCAIGIARNGDSQMAKIQVQSYVFLLLMAYLSAMILRGVEDYRLLGRVIVGAAVARSFYIFYVVHHLAGGADGPLAVAATHGDSLLLATAAVLLLVRLLEKPSARAAVWCAMVLPILAVAMAKNNRRLVWVEVAGGILVYALVSRRTRAKRLLANAVLISLPLIVVYIAAGWNSQASVFAPIKMFRSVSDGKVDSSTLYRDLENFNLMMTMRLHPFTGVGFGQPFAEVVTLPDISFFKEYRYIPHNSILGLWAYTGPLGFTGLFLPLTVAIILAIRSYRTSTIADERIAAIMVMSVVVIYLAHCWGDMGFSERRTIFLVGPVLAIAGQLAYKTRALALKKPGAN